MYKIWNLELGNLGTNMALIKGECVQIIKFSYWFGMEILIYKIFSNVHTKLMKSN